VEEPVPPRLGKAREQDVSGEGSSIILTVWKKRHVKASENPEARRNFRHIFDRKGGSYVKNTKRVLGRETTY